MSAVIHMPNVRDRLPPRRDSDVFDLEYEGQRYRVQVGTYHPGGQRIGEIFIDHAKVDSANYALAADGAVLISLLLQHGVSVSAIQRTLSRLPDGSPGSVFGAVLQRIAKMQAEAAAQ